MTKIELAWAAGLIDGEGCIHIHYSPPNLRQGTINPQHVLWLKVAMGCRRTVERLALIFGVGTVHRVPTKRHNPAFQWIVQSTRAAQVIRLLRPYFVTKAAEADVALEFDALPRKARGRVPIPVGLLKRRHAYYVRLREMKPSARFRSKRQPIPKLRSIPR